MSKSTIIVCFLLIIFLGLLIFILNGIFFNNWLGTPSSDYIKYIKNDSSTTLPPATISTISNEIFPVKDNTIDNIIKDNTINQKQIKQISSEKKDLVSYSYSKDELKYKDGIQIDNKIITKDKIIKDEKKDFYANFHTKGNYISEEEKKYRIKTVNNLEIKSIVIDYLTKGNGISQEFYKICFEKKMIPANILKEIVESKEFRDLIPEKYLKYESAISQFKKGEYIKINNYDIKKLLLLWSEGKLTPIQKAWKVKAYK